MLINKNIIIIIIVVVVVIIDQDKAFIWNKKAFVTLYHLKAWSQYNFVFWRRRGGLYEINNIIIINFILYSAFKSSISKHFTNVQIRSNK